MIVGFATRQTGLHLCAVRSPGRRSPAVDLSPVQQAVIFADLGDKERALEALDRMAVVGPAWMGSFTQPPGTGSASRRSAIESSSQEGRLAVRIGSQFGIAATGLPKPDPVACLHSTERFSRAVLMRLTSLFRTAEPLLRWNWLARTDGAM